MIGLIDKGICYEDTWSHFTYYIIFPNKYEVEIEIGIAMKSAYSEEIEYKLVHGSAYSMPYKRRLDHAWIENFVRDTSRLEQEGVDLASCPIEDIASLPREAGVLDHTSYFWGTKEEFCKLTKPRIDNRYTPFEATIMGIRTGTTGPWSQKQRAFLKTERFQKARKSYLQDLVRRAEYEKLKPFDDSSFKVVNSAPFTRADLRRVAFRIYLPQIYFFPDKIRHLRVTFPGIWWYLKRGRLPFVKIDRSIHLRPSHIEKWLEQGK